VPARDEEGMIVACLDGLRAAVDRVRPAVADAWVVVVADRCRDATVALARREVHGWGQVIEVDAGSAGAARAIGTAVALGRHRSPLHNLWLANTDADTVVPCSWLERQLRIGRCGIAAVAGVVAVDSFDEHPPHVPRLWASRYDGPEHLPHPHVHGANLGVRADAYVAVGGWSSGPTGEDRALWHALRAAGYPCASPRSLVVTTSGRARSRVRGGFADDLNGLAEAS
jgi:Glycosyl transferase family 2